jgi:hypothetical protein
MKITKAMLHAVSNFGAFKYSQLSILGVPIPPRHGWMNDVVGREIPDEDWRKVEQLREVKSKHDIKAVLNGNVSGDLFSNVGKDTSTGHSIARRGREQNVVEFGH